MQNFITLQDEKWAVSEFRDVIYFTIFGARSKSKYATKTMIAFSATNIRDSSFAWEQWCIIRSQAIFKANIGRVCNWNELFKTTHLLKINNQLPNSGIEKLIVAINNKLSSLRSLGKRAMPPLRELFSLEGAAVNYCSRQLPCYCTFTSECLII